MQRHRLVATGIVLIVTTLVALLAALQVDARVAGSRQQSGVIGAPTQVKQLWKTQVSHEAEGAPYFDAARNWLYVNSGPNGAGTGILAILDADTSSVINSVKTRAIFGYSSVIPVGDALVCANEFNWTTCRDKTTLATKWEFQGTHDFANTPLYVPLKNALYVTIAGTNAANEMYKLDAKTGHLIATSAQLPGSYLNTPSFSKKQNLVFAGDDKYIIALDADTLILSWKYSTNKAMVRTTGVLSEDESIVYFASFKAIYALHAAAGKELWKVPYGSPNTPSLHKGVLYAGLSGSFAAFNAETGKQLWSVKSNSTYGGGVNHGNSHIYGDLVVFPVQKGIAAVALNGSGVVWYWAGSIGYVQLFPPPWAGAAGGKIFCSDWDGYVYALQIPAPSGNSDSEIVEKH